MFIPEARLLPAGRRPDVLLLATNSGMAFAIARCLDLAGLRFQVLAPGRYWSTQTMRSCVGAALIDIAELDGNDGQILHVLRRVIQASPQVVVVPAGIQATYALARYAGVLPASNVFPLSPEPLLRRLHDKWAFAGLLGSIGIPHPRTWLVSSAAEVESIEIGAAVVVKPFDAEGSQGVQVARSRPELRAAIAGVERAGLLPVLCQDYIPGDDLALMLVADQGKVMASRLHQNEPSGELKLLDRTDALALGEAIVADQRIHGVVNFDLRRDERDDRLWVTECNPRLYATVHKTAYSGMNPVAMGVSIARGVALDEAEEPTATLIEAPLTSLAKIARGRGASLTPATRRALRAETSNPVSSLIRAAEWRLPRLARVARGEPATRWEAFSESS